MDDLVFYNPEIPAWGVLLLWPLQASIFIGFIIVLAVSNARDEDGQRFQPAHPSRRRGGVTV